MLDPTRMADWQIAEAAEATMRTPAGEVSPAHGACEERVPRKDKSLFRKVVAPASRSMPGGLEDLESEGRERRVRGGGKPFDCAVPGHHAVHRRGVERQILRRAPHGKPIPGNQARNTPDVVEMRMGQKNPRGLEAGLLNGGGNLLRAMGRPIPR